MITPLHPTLPEVDLDFTLRNGAPAAPWEVLQFELDEALSELFVASLIVASPDALPDVDGLLDRPATFTVRRGGLARHVHGIVAEAEDLGRGPTHHFARVTVVPALWSLQHRVDSRIFQRVDVLAIVREVLQAHGLHQLPDALVVSERLRRLGPRECCVQYQESDLAFVRRLLESEGIAFHLRSGDDPCLVLSDDASCWLATPTLDGRAISITGSDAALSVESIGTLDPARRVRPRGVVLRDHDFTHPSMPPAFTPSSPPNLAPAGRATVYEHPGAFHVGPYDMESQAYRGHDGAHLARVRAEELAATRHTLRGRSNVTGLAPGGVFTPAGHLRPELDQPMLVTRVRHAGSAWGDVADALRADPRFESRLRDAGARLSGARYENSFECVPAQTPWRPARATPRPVVHGVQTATVTATPEAPGDEIATDFHGRVLVRFHWDRPELRGDAQQSQPSSCWVRVAQSWAGAGWGTTFVPRVGMEVVVQFVDGDPDRPLAVGCVYNRENTAPFGLPEDASRSGLRTRSTPGGDGHNELSFEDRAGDERVFMRAQRDHVEHVLHDQTTDVTRDRLLRVGASRTAYVQARDSLTVGGDRMTVVEHDDALTVEGNHTLDVQGDRGAAVTVDRNADVRVDGRVVVVARQELVLECGTSRIVMTPDRITLRAETVDTLAARDNNIEGAMVNINCDDADDDLPSRSAAMREQMLRLGMGGQVEALGRAAAESGLDGRALWKRTAAALNDLLVEQPDTLQDRLVLRAGMTLEADRDALAHHRSRRRALHPTGGPARVEGGRGRVRARRRRSAQRRGLRRGGGGLRAGVSPGDVA
jgi:type VI secretion system secreted protein VgrG